MYLGKETTLTYKFNDHFNNEVWMLNELLQFALNHDLTLDEVIARPEFYNYRIVKPLLAHHDYLKEIKQMFSGVEVVLIVRHRSDNIQIVVRPKNQL